MDALSRMLQTVRILSSTYFWGSFAHPWGIQVPAYSGVVRCRLVLRGHSPTFGTRPTLRKIRRFSKVRLLHFVDSPHRFGLPAHYELHVWAWRDDPRRALWIGTRACHAKGSDPTTLLADRLTVFILGRRVMPLFMDVHKHIEGLTAEAVAHAHQADLKTQDKYGVKYLRYWFDEGTGKVFCLIDAPSKEAAIAVHREAHGLVADELIEVKEGA